MYISLVVVIVVVAFVLVVSLVLVRQHLSIVVGVLCNYITIIVSSFGNDFSIVISSLCNYISVVISCLGNNILVVSCDVSSCLHHTFLLNADCPIDIFVTHVLKSRQEKKDKSGNYAGNSHDITDPLLVSVLEKHEKSNVDVEETSSSSCHHKEEVSSDALHFAGTTHYNQSKDSFVNIGHQTKWVKASKSDEV